VKARESAVEGTVLWQVACEMRVNHVIELKVKECIMYSIHHNNLNSRKLSTLEVTEVYERLLEGWYIQPALTSSLFSRRKEANDHPVANCSAQAVQWDSDCM
jgi:hypothetical protein